MQILPLIYSLCSLSTRKRVPQSRAFSSANFYGYKIPDSKKELAYEKASQSAIKMPVIILVNPFLDANVGSASRAMLNFGMSELRIVDPRCDILSESAQALAAGSIEVLKNAKIFPTLKECVSDLQRVIATTARTRDMTQAVLTPQSAAATAINKECNVNVGIVFGRERNGLTNEELALADSYIFIPTFPSFSSLNLAQAVNIVCYEVWKHKLELESTLPPDYWLESRDYDRIIRREELDSFLNRLESTLSNTSYQTNLERREQCFRNIRNIFQRVRTTLHITYSWL